MSSTVISPLAALAVAPLVSSTCTLWYAFDQYHFLSIFTTRVDRDKSNTILPSYFKHFFATGLPRVLGLLGLTCLSVAGNYYYRHDDLLANQSMKWYLAGAAFAVSHLSFTPVVLPRIKALQARAEWKSVRERRSEFFATQVLEEWLYYHAIRTYTVDVAAWACLAVAVILNVNA